MIIKEFLPNPIGNDKEGEYITLFNNGDVGVFLDGWRVQDAGGKLYQLTGELAPGKELVLFYTQTGISLNNNGEYLSLFNNADELVDILKYSGVAPEGMVVKRHVELIDEGTEILEGKINVSRPTPFSQILFIDIVTAIILGALMLYVALQLEKKLETKLF